MIKGIKQALYQEALNKKYNGRVSAKEQYINPNATLVHHCKICVSDFYGKPSHMLGKDHQKHICTMPYGDKFGNRFTHVSTFFRNNSKKKKVNSDIVAKRFNEMIFNDYTYQEIAKELDLTPELVKEYFKAEGLI